MSVIDINSWRMPGCDDRCWPRVHSPEAHEQYGRILEREAQQRAGGIRTGALAINLGAGVAMVHGVEVRLSGREWQLLVYLTERIGQWCPTAEVYAAIWGAWGSPAAQYKLVAVTRFRLRERLGPDARGLIDSDTSNRSPKTRLLKREVLP